jgi:histone H3/H4
MLRRHHKVLRDNIQGITVSTTCQMCELAAASDITNVADTFFEEIRGVMKVKVQKLVRDAVTCAEHGRRRAVLAQDVLAAAVTQNHEGPAVGFCSQYAPTFASAGLAATQINKTCTVAESASARVQVYGSCLLRGRKPLLVADGNSKFCSMPVLTSLSWQDQPKYNISEEIG